MKSKELSNEFNLGSFLCLILFTLALLQVYSIISDNTQIAFILMLISFIIYVLNNIYLNLNNNSSVFNEYLEDMSAFFAFAISSIIFALYHFNSSLLILSLVFFYSLASLLALGRNWILGTKNSVGFPIALNGLFLPLIYFFNLLYLDNIYPSIFLLYFLIVGFLSISHINFLGHYTEKEIYQINEETNLKNNTNENKINTNENENIINSKNEDKIISNSNEIYKINFD